MNDLSIIIPFYNASNTIEYCLRSILNQEYKFYDLIFVDDGSSDNTREKIKNILNESHKVNYKYIYTKNYGVSHARNIGLRKCKTKYVLFMDSDDILSKNCLNILLNNSKEYDIMVFNYIKIYDYNKYMNKYNFKLETKHIFDRNEFLKNIFEDYKGFLWNKIYKMDIIRDFEIKFDEDSYICEDLLFNTRYGLHIKKGIYLNYVGYLYYQNLGGSYNNQKDIKWFSIINTYDKIENILLQNDIDFQILHYEKYDRMYIYCEAIIRNKINKNKFNGIETAKKYIKQNYKIVFSSKYISLKKKIKLFLFIKFPKLVYKYKKRRR